MHDHNGYSSCVNAHALNQKKTLLKAEQPQKVRVPSEKIMQTILKNCNLQKFQKLPISDDVTIIID